MVMEPLEHSNGLGQSMNDSFSLYERYMRSFNIVDSRVEKKDIREASDATEPVSPSNSYCDSSDSRGNIDLSTAQSNVINKHRDITESECNLLNNNTCDNIADKLSDSEFNRAEAYYQSNSPAAESLLDNSSTTAENSHLTERSNQTGFLLVSSEETKRECFKPLFLTSTMENSNNAVDSVPMFRDVRHAETVFKLPNIELTFNGTIKHVQKLTPIVDPVTALSSQNLVNLEGKSEDLFLEHKSNLNIESNAYNSSDQKSSDASDEKSLDVETLEKTSESPGDPQYEESNLKKEFLVNDDESSTKWNLEHSHSSFETSFDSGVRSPNVFSDDDENDGEPVEEPEPFWNFLKDYEASDKKKVRKLEENLQGILPPPSVTIVKTDVTEMLKKYYNFLPLFNGTAKLNVSEEANSTTPTKRVSFIEIPQLQETSRNAEDVASKTGLSDTKSRIDLNLAKLNSSDVDTSVTDKIMCTEIEAVETSWPNSLKCRHHDVYAATINEKAQASHSKMVLIDKKKLVNSSERKSPRLRRTPGKKTPNRRTPGRKTPAKTPKTRSGGSSKKKAMRRLLMDSESMTRSQPSRETLKRALFLSPEDRKSIPVVPSTSVPLHAMKTKRALFGSPVRADTKSLDSDQFLKRKRDSLDDIPGTSKSKIAKSLSFGGGTMGPSEPISFNRRASEVFTKRSTDLNDNHKQSREKASHLARLMRRLLTLPPYAARSREKASHVARLTQRLLTLPPYAARDCFEEEHTKLTNEANNKVTGYISANAYQLMKSRQNATTLNPQIKENSCISLKQEPKSATKNVLQDKLLNIDSNSNSSGISMIDKGSLGIFKSNSMPSFEEAAKMRARRQISFDNVDFPKSLMKKFHSICPEKLVADQQHRFTKEEIVKKFDVLKNNPFQDRLFRVFSSKKDDCFSFEDLLDMCSAMSAECPPDVKAAWAFKVYDLDEDNQISSRDIIEILDRLTWHPLGVENQLDKESKMKIADVVST
ncbi:Neuronal calcium sensor [Operophtera brumata]|uniref:Neuronal calcium sensor n=1 Tax=Operophtera brumata TaxID=104452 RepID=A0A0L7LBP5_OPEBR|nr:Neuronal calcium sensor [Operophtera brumata]